MSAKSSPFPDTEGELNVYLLTAVPYILANEKRFNLNAANKQKLTDGLTLWNTTYKLASDPTTRTTIAIANKDDAKEALLTVLRAVYGDIPDSVVTNQDRATLGIKAGANNGKRTPAPVPATKPIAKVDHSKRLEHTIHFSDSVKQGKGKPDGVHGCQIWYAMDEAPKTIDDLRYLATDTKTPYVHHFEIEEAGKTVWYWLRWENTRNEVGPWSEPVSATVPG